MRQADHRESASRSAQKHEQCSQNARHAALQTTWRADSEDPADQQPEIEGAGMNQQPLEDVRMTAQMRAAHASRVVEVRERALDPLTASPHQAASSSAANPATIAIHRRLGFRLLRPVALTAVRLGDIGADAEGVEF